MMMRKSLIALGAAAAVGLAVTAAPQPAHAVWWVAPAIVAGVVGGVAVGSAAANANNYAYYNGPGDVYVEPSPAVTSCRWIQTERHGRIVRERICG
jgi:hypothetical protein